MNQAKVGVTLQRTRFPKSPDKVPRLEKGMERGITAATSISLMENYNARQFMTGDIKHFRPSEFEYKIICQIEITSIRPCDWTL